jgi:glyoxylase-like metal-dependent hydrolase (beta-lactamase superfamily II)/8-oxo-dGTP pyrophosphatase MutT (NUDIX family)
VNPAPLRAASVLLTRGPGSPEVFTVRRAEGLRFMGNFWAFPGGKVQADDPHPQASAARELFEETGVLVARRADGSFPPADAALAEARRALLADTLAWGALLAERGLTVRPDDFLYAGSIVTPEFNPVRFDTSFYVCACPPGQDPEVWPGELTEGAWGTAEELLADWARGGRLLSPPTVSLLETVRGHLLDELPQRAAPLLERLARGGHPPIWFSPGVGMVPARTLALPPSTHTNAYLVGTDRLYLIDPGPKDLAEQEKLFASVDELLAGRRLTAVVLTHHHPDHVGGATASARHYDAPVLAHPITAKMLEDKVKVDATLDGGARLEMGVAPDGAGEWYLESILTPGHAPGHLAFYERRYGLLFTGDMVSTVSSVVICPPEGDLAVYLASLRRLLDFPARLLLPAHGSASARPTHVIEQCLFHRKQREDELVALLGDAPRAVKDLAQTVYRGLPAPLMRFAELQVLAGLQKLQSEGRAALDGTGWVKTPA